LSAFSKKTWFPEQHNRDALFALLRNFVYFLHYPVAKETIRAKISALKNPFVLTEEPLRDLLMSLGIECFLYTPDVTQPERIPSPSIVSIRENVQGFPSARHVIFTGVKNGKVSYLHTRKGFVKEDQALFIQKWNKTVLTAVSVNLNTESGFDAKEKAWASQMGNHPMRKNITVVENFLTDDECEGVIQLALDRFKRSTVMGIENNFDARRTSFTAKLDIPDNLLLNKIREKAAVHITMPTTHFEFFQCISYAIGQEYDVHYDTLDEIHEKELIEKEGQRKFTLLAYLNDAFEGGETHFPFLDLLIQPKKGSLLIFNNLDENEKVIKEMLHSGKPVWEGQKFAMNMWVRTKPQEQAHQNETASDVVKK